MSKPSVERSSANLERLRQAIARSGLSSHGLAVVDDETRAEFAEALLDQPELTAPGEAIDPTAAALAVLESDPDLAELLDGSVPGEKPRDFSTLPEVLTATTAAMLVLSSYVEVERDKDGRWRFHFIVKPQTDKLKSAILNLAKSLTTIT